MEFRSIYGPLRHKLIIIIVIVVTMIGYSQAWTQEYYTGAVYEHNRQGNITTDDAPSIIKSNLEYYKRATREAKKQGADIILFPEYGIFPPLNRSEIKKFLEFVPDPNELSVTPCDEAKLFADRPIMYSLSCMAKINKIVVVANMGGLEKCGDEAGCPEDGDLHLNTNVVFDSKGTLITRYYKEHLFYEFGMDLPTKIQNPIFDTEFGKFATFICFDIMFEKMAQTSRLEDVDAVLFSTMWMNMSPYFTSTQFWQTYAIANNITILASNIQMPGYLAAGSGIFKGRKNSVAHALNPDGISKLIVARIPRGDGSILSASIMNILKNDIREYKDDGKDIPDICAYKILGPAKDIQKDYRCISESVQNHTLVKLNKSEDHVQVCNNNMCCELNYSANNMNESYYFGVHNGTRDFFTRYSWSEESCFLGRCDDVNGTECSNFPMASHGILFYRVSMKANFTTKYIYPSFLSNKLRLIPAENWSFDRKPDWSSIAINNRSGIPLIAATLHGRVYEKDPPYIR